MTSYRRTVRSLLEVVPSYTPKRQMYIVVSCILIENSEVYKEKQGKYRHEYWGKLNQNEIASACSTFYKNGPKITKYQL